MDGPDFALEVQIAYLHDFEFLVQASDSNPRTYGSSHKSITRPAFIFSRAFSRDYQASQILYPPQAAYPKPLHETLKLHEAWSRGSLTIAILSSPHTSLLEYLVSNLATH